MKKKIESKEETILISKIAHRASKLTGHPVITFSMDLTYCHEKNPLRLQELLYANDGDFLHDIMGINQNLNHETHKLENCFSPRYSVIQ